jgi:predicted metal-dependent hydrolase
MSMRWRSPFQLELFGEPTRPSEPPAESLASPSAELPIELVRSARRRRTYKWSLVNGSVRLEVPAGLRPSEERRILAQVAATARERLQRSERASDAELLARARALARRYLPEVTPFVRSVAWSDRQEHRWGSCSTDTGAIRLSARLHGFPEYVLDAVLVHELAHLIEPNHTARFRALAQAYPQAERARGFLEAVDRGLLAASDSWPDALD